MRWGGKDSKVLLFLSQFVPTCSALLETQTLMRSVNVKTNSTTLMTAEVSSTAAVCMRETVQVDFLSK